MPEPLKNMFNARLIGDLATALSPCLPGFDAERFHARIFDAAWDQRELKDRMRHIVAVLHDFLPADYPAAIQILREVAPRLHGYGFEMLIFPNYVEIYGRDHWGESFAAMEQFTQQSSAEMAVRPFIEQDQARAMAQMLAWTQHPSEHLRRLASEGCRPRLPWASPLRDLQRDPALILPILHALKNDPSEYVRRSVANNLNDIAKDHPPVVIAVLREWGQNPTPEINAITRHSLRTLIKAGNAEALALLGFQHSAQVEVGNWQISPTVITLGETITFSLEIASTSDAPQELVIDYVIHFVKSNGSRAPKVFKLTTRTLPPHSTITLSKRHAIKPITTRVYYPGEHALAVQINGVEYAGGTFELKMP